MPEILWAPWRMEYIERPSVGSGASTDIFLELPQQDNDRDNLILHRGKSAFVMLNLYPYTNGHLLIAPYRQVAELENLNDEELLEVNKLLAQGVRWLKLAYNPDGFNVGINLGRAAGAGIPIHIHWHIVPRWSGDTNFMTTVANTRVMPEELGTCYDRLKRIVEA